MDHHRRLSLACFMIVILVTSSTSVPYQQASGKTKTEQSPSVVGEQTPDLEINPVSLFVKAFAIIAVFSMALYFFLRVYKYFVQGKSVSRQSAQIRVLGSSMIGPKKSLCLVGVLDHVLVLGVTDAQITVLLDLPMEKVDDQVKNSLLDQSGVSQRSFNAILKNWMKKS